MTTVQAGPYTVRGVSVGGVYTCLQVPELGVVLDCGVALRSFAATDDLFLSHGHADHVGALGAMLGIRGLMRKPGPRVFMPAAIEAPLGDALSALSSMQRYDLGVDAVGMEAGDEREVRGDLRVRAFRTFHPVPSLGYQFFRRVQKLKPEFRELPGAEIGARRKAGEDLFYVEDRLELAYATDTLLSVIDRSPEILTSKVLILECSFLDDKKRLADARAGCHVHLDELVEVADRFENEHLVLMHFSQIYSPRDVHRILEERLAPRLKPNLVPFAPSRGPWFG